MFGYLLISLGTFFEELSASLGKRNLQREVIGIHGQMFLHQSVALLMFAGIAIFVPGAFVFSLAGLPLFLLRAVLEVFQAISSITALKVADRTTFAFIRTLTIPGLLLVDVALGYKLETNQIIGILIVLFVLMVIFLGKQFSKAGIWFAVFSSLNAVITVSLFKYNITHYNSIVADQFFMLIIMMAYSSIAISVHDEKNPFSMIREEKTLIAQTLLDGVSSVFQSFSYHFLPPSMLMAIKRFLSVFWALLSGRVIFGEMHPLIKAGVAALFCLSIILLSGA